MLSGFLLSVLYGGSEASYKMRRGEPTDRVQLRFLYSPMNLARSLMPPSVAHLESATRRPWATASVPESPDTTPGELSALGAHVDRCNGSRSRLFGLQCAGDALRSFIAPRLVTTTVIVAFVIGVATLLI